MSRRRNKIRAKRELTEEQYRQWAAAEDFTSWWMTTGLAYELVAGYDCTLTCEEAETMADLFRAFRYPNTAASILADHGEGDKCAAHYRPAAQPTGIQVKE